MCMTKPSISKPHDEELLDYTWWCFAAERTPPTEEQLFKSKIRYYATKYARDMLFKYMQLEEQKHGRLRTRGTGQTTLVPASGSNFRY